MEKTFQDLYQDLQSATGDTSSTALVKFKGWINRALTTFQGRMPGRFIEQYRIANAVGSQEQYQRPEDVVRIVGIEYYDGSTYIPLTQIPDDDRWRWMRSTPQTSAQPLFYHLRGDDLYEIFPAPVASAANAIRLNVKIRQRMMTADNYTTGTVSVLPGSINVIGVGTTFTAQMVGRRIKLADSVGDGIWYRIAGYTSATSIQLENFYQGLTATGANFTIAEIPNLPVELNDTIHDYGMWRYNLDKKEVAAAREFKAIWENDLEVIGALYKDDTEQQVFPPEASPDLSLSSGLMQIPRNVT